MKNDRRERTSRAQDLPPAPKRAERRSPAFYATRGDVALLVVLITLLDTLVKLLIVALA